MTQKSKRPQSEAERKFRQGQVTFNQMVENLKQTPTIVGKKTSGGKK